MACQYVDGPAHQMGARHPGAVHADHQAVPGGLIPDRVVDGAGRRHMGVLGFYPDEPDGTRRSVEDVSGIQRFRGAVVDDDDLVIDILDGSLQWRKEGPQGTRHFPLHLVGDDDYGQFGHAAVNLVQVRHAGAEPFDGGDDESGWMVPHTAWSKPSWATRKTDDPQPRKGASSSIQAFLNFSYV